METIWLPAPQKGAVVVAVREKEAGWHMAAGLIHKAFQWQLYNAKHAAFISFSPYFAVIDARPDGDLFCRAAPDCQRLG